MSLIVPPTQKHQLSMDEEHPHFDYSSLGKGIAFPEIPYYGPKHGENTAKMSLVLLSHFGPEHDTKANRHALWTAALFHDIGRQHSYSQDDPGHAERGAAILDKILKGHHALWGDEALRERACRLVLNHSGKLDQNDPLAASLHDADAYEAMRIAPNTHLGLAYKKERIPNLGDLWTPFCREKKNLRRYSTVQHGWR